MSRPMPFVYAKAVRHIGSLMMSRRRLPKVSSSSGSSRHRNSHKSTPDRSTTFNTLYSKRMPAAKYIDPHSQ
eukprot:CAMPEP_0174376720 /NCGR_PEP_ID=MMETSP0811_2-20130205/119266_1 /TAXON_ID=73025 ORGANISM="Eutreptiella gymnastica-like, Strain CCMP1594" /NCGR_SAMPLE_ID=MMETSP0811_2 /ASSEMBLY_ACC=CAM_ASM_000667 /LENGTH=71 /DNA_ID=CAMNT_0015528203 /DNA_START=108 /DNA_END=323 /DNA_ORIENTATION=+